MPSTLLWIAQALLSVVFTLTGVVKLFMPRERLQTRMHWAKDWPRWRIKLLGAAEIAGAIGLVLPRATAIAPMLTPLAAACLAVLMAGAVRTHRRLREPALPAAVIGALCVLLAAALFAGRVHT
jgi:uncharacterized membrane protein